MMMGRTFGPYYIINNIRLGGMLADVYLATDRAGQRYALRLLRAPLRDDRTLVRQFLESTELINEFDHPNVIKLLAFGKIERVPYAALEYVESSDLKALMLRAHPALAARTPSILWQVALGLKHIHDRGYLHLDVKPENVLVPNEGAVRIIDFDLAIPRPERQKKLRRISGTLAYLAPELIADQLVDERTDIFAYGVMAYKLLTGREPVTGATRKEMLSKYADYKHNFIPPRRHNPRMSAALEKVVLHCLEKDPSRRYPAMSLVLRDLQLCGEITLSRAGHGR